MVELCDLCLGAPAGVAVAGLVQIGICHLGETAKAIESSCQFARKRLVLKEAALRRARTCYDHFAGERFRHGTRLLRWRPDKAPKQCTFEQVKQKKANLMDLLRANARDQILDSNNVRGQSRVD